VIVITKNTAHKLANKKLDQKSDIHIRHQASQRKNEATSATQTTVKFKLYLHGEIFIVIVIINNTAHDTDNHQQTYKRVSNTHTIGS
jgi:hypothetical protein